MFNINDMWCILGRGATYGGLVVGTIIMPELSEAVGEACYASLQGGDFTMNDAPQGNQGRGTALMHDLFSSLTPPSRANKS